MAAESMHRRDLPSTEDDELPGYVAPENESEELPTYERSSSISTPSITLQFRQMTRKLTALDSTDAAHDVHYKLTAKSGPRLFSSKPATALTLERGGLSMCVGTMQFDDSSSFPWVPRARVDVDVAGAGCRLVDMRSANFTDWTFAAHDGGPELTWVLQKRPTSLELRDEAAGRSIARFCYSFYGTTASKGLPVGDLEIYPTAAAESSLTTEAVILTATAVVRSFERMGRHHRMDTPAVGRYSYGTGVTLMGRSSAVTWA